MTKFFTETRVDEQEDISPILDNNLSSSPSLPKKVSSSSPKTEEEYYSNIVPGILYAVGPGGINRYTPKSCFNGGGCRVSCVLYNENGECDYKNSMKKPDMYRKLDNLVGVIPSSQAQTSHVHEPFVVKRELVVGKHALQEVVLHPNVTPPVLEISKKILEDKMYEEIDKL